MTVFYASCSKCQVAQLVASACEKKTVRKADILIEAIQGAVVNIPDRFL